MQVKLYDGTRKSWDAYHQVNATREALAQVVKAHPPADVATAAGALDAKLLALAGTGIGGRGGRGGPVLPPNFTSLNGTEPEEGAVMVSMNGQLKIQDYGDMAPTETMRKGWTQVCRTCAPPSSEWQAINAKDLVAFNALLTKNKLQPIPAASPAIAMPVCTVGSANPSDREWPVDPCKRQRQREGRPLIAPDPVFGRHSPFASLLRRPLQSP